MSKTSKRYAIIKLHRAGVSNSMIIKQHKVPKSTVYDTVARFKELGDDKDRPRSGCPRTARSSSSTACELVLGDSIRPCTNGVSLLYRIASVAPLSKPQTMF